MMITMMITIRQPAMVPAPEGAGGTRPLLLLPHHIIVLLLLYHPYRIDLSAMGVWPPFSLLRTGRAPRATGEKGLPSTRGFPLQGIPPL